MVDQSYRQIARRKSKKIFVGNVPVGGDSPISVQSMTNTLTHDYKSTIAQIHSLESAGADIVRVSCPDKESTDSLKKIVDAVSVPIVADIHFHYKRAIESAESGASCIRINPGNIGSSQRVKEVVKAAKDFGCSIRIGVNAGSLERHLLDKYGGPTPEALVESALAHAHILEVHGFENFKISVKASDIFLAIASYRLLAKKIDSPLHVGVTEAGGLISGITKSAIGMGQLLLDGIGDTIRVSLSADPIEEVRAGFEILKSLNIRHRGVRIVSCPSCARQGFDVVRTVDILEKRLAHIIEPVSVSIIGCVVNGPGEATMTDFGITGGGNKVHKIFVSGLADHNINDDKKIDHLVNLIEEKVSGVKNNKRIIENSMQTDKDSFTHSIGK